MKSGIRMKTLLFSRKQAREALAQRRQDLKVVGTTQSQRIDNADMNHELC